ncbi:lipopolysaccharide biosynthesis protein [Flavobacterium sp.]|uniref:lipopolysaccharide biosynthesis protein n=1 Tax=Flavobacterium sp. TaxID=239 RepID=UPI0022BD2515|nr:polysaccharide biosynthesis C-terminal domain-containing protein [Flavobacterium sp.]MCZ8144511.1 polysaccharide biosynthesis C-terminal domain-containing protein [Flavobacterium sp.]MCZ8365889.1 polysaccharide biosynthesis C-terminal domain-containing protein [Flavobacterium sp.]
MSLYKNLFKQTLIYGLATVLPRLISFILNPIYVKFLPDRSMMGEVSIIFSYLVFFNVFLSYGMETAFFRFYNAQDDKKKVISTSTISLFWSSIGFLVIGLLFRNTLSKWSDIDVEYITYTLWILTLDALTIIPFSKLRVEKKPIQYAVIKVSNTLINLALTLLFLGLFPYLVKQDSSVFFKSIYIENFQIGYIFIANLIASLATFLVLIPNYTQIRWQFDFALWKQMMRYGYPILFAGIAFAINEHFDKILLDWFHVPLADIGAYSACYKIGMFMVLFRTAYSLGIEPFFFSHAGNENAPQTYATITKYFVIFGSFISLAVIAFIDLLKQPLVPNAAYWDAIKVVPLIVFANFFLGIYTNLSVWYKLIDKTLFGAYISFVGALVTLALNYLLIPKYSYYGSALATIAAYGSMMIISYHLGKKKYPIPYDFNRIFSYLGLSIGFSILAFYVDYIRDNYPLKVLLLLVFLFFIYRSEKETLLRILRRK